MNFTIFFTGPNDKKYGQSLMHPLADGRKGITTRGSICLFELIVNDKKIATNSKNFICGINKKIVLSRERKFNLFNLAANAEICQDVLKAGAALTKAFPFNRVFNHPAAVSKTLRERAYSNFGDINGLIVPKTFNVQYPYVNSVKAILEKGEARYPFIARMYGEHNGTNMELISNQSELEHWYTTAGSKDIQLTEYVEEKNEFGYFHKIRVVFIDGKYYPRHRIVSKDWCIHSRSRADYMLKDKLLREQEADFLANFENIITPSQHRIFHELNQRIGLDVWGLDCAIQEGTGNILLYEANASMALLPYDNRPEFYYLNGYTRNIRHAIKNMLLHS